MTAIDRLLGLISNVAYKAPCRVIATTNLTLNGLQTVDGVALAANDRVLVAGQTDTTQNGIYKADTGNWTRDSDLNGTRDCVQGTQVLVAVGTAHARTVWAISTANPVPGQALAWVQI